MPTAPKTAFIGGRPRVTPTDSATRLHWACFRQECRWTAYQRCSDTAAPRCREALFALGASTPGAARSRCETAAGAERSSAPGGFLMPADRRAPLCASQRVYNHSGEESYDEMSSLPCRFSLAAQKHTYQPGRIIRPIHRLAAATRELSSMWKNHFDYSVRHPIFHVNTNYSTRLPSYKAAVFGVPKNCLASPLPRCSASAVC